MTELLKLRDINLRIFVGAVDSRLVDETDNRDGGVRGCLGSGLWTAVDKSKGRHEGNRGDHLGRGGGEKEIKHIKKKLT